MITVRFCVTLHEIFWLEVHKNKYRVSNMYNMDFEQKKQILIKKYLLVRLLRLVGFVECIEAHNYTTPAISDIDYTTFEF